MEMLCLESSSGFCEKARDICAPFVPQRLSNVPHLRKKKQKFRKDKAIPENRHFSAVERRTILNVIIIVIGVDSLR